MFIKDSIISLCFYDFLGWRCVLAGIYTCEHRAQMGNVYNSITVTWASSSKHDEFHFSFSIAQFYESNLISHVFVRRIPWAQVHFLIQRHEWCLESFGNCTSHWECLLETFPNKMSNHKLWHARAVYAFLCMICSKQNLLQILLFVHSWCTFLKTFLTSWKMP